MILTFRPAWRSFTTAYIVFLALVVIFQEFNILHFLMIFYIICERYGSKLTLSDDEVVQTKGFFKIERVAIHLANIELLPINQTPWQRLIGIGTVSILDTSNPQSIILFRGLREPQRFYEELLHWHQNLMLGMPEQNTQYVF